MKPDYGPLEMLLGVWKGDKGLDKAPKPGNLEETPYFETIAFEAVGDVKNAGSQTLAVVRYHQSVSRKSDSEIFHDEIGYWMWDAEAKIAMHSLTIPRAVSILAGGPWSGGDLEVRAALGDPDWGIIQSPFMRDNAKTIEFRHRLAVKDGTMRYFETTVVEIYGRIFEHTDENELKRT